MTTLSGWLKNIHEYISKSYAVQAGYHPIRATSKMEVGSPVEINYPTNYQNNKINRKGKNFISISQRDHFPGTKNIWLKTKDQGCPMIIFCKNKGRFFHGDNLLLLAKSPL